MSKKNTVVVPFVVQVWSRQGYGEWEDLSFHRTFEGAQLGLAKVHPSLRVRIVQNVTVSGRYNRMTE
jgi:hypothetical protein